MVYDLGLWKTENIYGSVNFKRAAVLAPRALSGICHFVLEKLQMPHGGAGRSHKKPQGGA